MHPLTKPDTGYEVPLPEYSGPKAKIAIADFDIGNSRADKDTVANLTKVFSAALTNSNRFRVVEAKSADLIINVVIIEFIPEASGGRSGVGGGGGAKSSALPALLGNGSSNKARIAIDMRITDAASLKTIATGVIKAQAQDASMEGATKICVEEAMRYIWQVVPQVYYKY